MNNNTMNAVEVTWDEMLETFTYNLITDLYNKPRDFKQTLSRLGMVQNVLSDVKEPSKKGIENAVFYLTHDLANSMIPDDLMMDIKRDKADLILVGDHLSVLAVIPNEKLK